MKKQSRMASEHPDTEVLAGFIEAPESEESASIAAHLVQCAQCRRNVAQLQATSDAVKQQARFRTPNAQLSETEALDIAGYVEGNLSEGEAKAMKTRLAKDATAMKAALQYAAHSTAMQSQRHGDSDADGSPESSERSKPPASGRQAGLITGPMHWFRSRLAVQQQFAVAAAVVLSVLIVWAINIQPGQSMAVAVYQDRSVIEIEQPGGKRPGIGFFGSAEKTKIPYQGLDARFSRGKLHVVWPPVDAATDYQLRVDLVAGDTQEMLGEYSTQTTQVIIENIAPQPGARYLWTLSGKRIDGSTFKTSGGLVFVQR